MIDMFRRVTVFVRTGKIRYYISVLFAFYHQIVLSVKGFVSLLLSIIHLNSSFLLSV